jgi:hypothetical protein
VEDSLDHFAEEEAVEATDVAVEPELAPLDRSLDMVLGAAHLVQRKLLPLQKTLIEKLEDKVHFFLESFCPPVVKYTSHSTLKQHLGQEKNAISKTL